MQLRGAGQPSKCHHQIPTLFFELNKRQTMVFELIIVHGGYP